MTFYTTGRMLLMVLLLYIVWQYFELKKFRVTTYQVTSPKVEQAVGIMVLTDLHGYSYGLGNQKLLASIAACHPAVILIVGDMICAQKQQTYRTALALLQKLQELAPVFYSYGNHESFMTENEHFQEYEKSLKEIGITILNNENQFFHIGEVVCAIGGCDIARSFYKKGQDVPMEQGYVRSVMGAAADRCLQILLAHNPTYAEHYVDWGADLTFCGHNHGGLIHIPGVGSLLSPQLTFFPQYNAGCYHIKDKHVIVSRGLGTHTFHIRIFNRAEVLFVAVKPEIEEKNKMQLD